MIAAVRVSRFQKVCAPWRASSIRSVSSPRVTSTRLRQQAITACSQLGIPAHRALLGGVSTAVPPGGLGGGEGPPVEALVGQQLARRRGALEQVGGDLALVDRGRHDAPGTHDPRAQVGRDREPKAVEPLGVRGVTADAGDQPVRADPAVAGRRPGRGA